MAKMDLSAAYMALAVWNGYVRDARRHARQWRPVEQVLQGSKDVGLGARARSRSSLCESSSVSSVDLVLEQWCMLLLKNYEYKQIKFHNSPTPILPAQYLPVLVP
jgi:hypothetical protein